MGGRRFCLWQGLSLPYLWCLRFPQTGKYFNCKHPWLDSLRGPPVRVSTWCLFTYSNKRGNVFLRIQTACKTYTCLLLPINYIYSLFKYPESLGGLWEVRNLRSVDFLVICFFHFKNRLKNATQTVILSFDLTKIKRQFIFPFFGVWNEKKTSVSCFFNICYENEKWMAQKYTDQSTANVETLDLLEHGC